MVCLLRGWGFWIKCDRVIAVCRYNTVIFSSKSSQHVQKNVHYIISWFMQCYTLITSLCGKLFYLMIFFGRRDYFQSLYYRNCPERLESCALILKNCLFFHNWSDAQLPRGYKNIIYTFCLFVSLFAYLDICLASDCGWWFCNYYMLFMGYACVLIQLVYFSRC